MSMNFLLNLAVRDFQTNKTLESHQTDSRTLTVLVR
jgi:hypothetical protein